MLVKLVFFCNCDCESVEHVLWECSAYNSNRSVFINSLSRILCSDFHLMSAFEKTGHIFDQSIWECNGHFDHWFSNIKSFLCGVWNLRKEKLYPEDFSMKTASNSSVERTRGQWQKCYGKVSMNIYYYYCETV